MTLLSDKTYSLRVSTIHTTASLFDDLGGPAEVGRALGIKTEHAASFVRRKRIPPRYWPSLLSALRGKGIELSEADLLRVYNAADDALQDQPLAADGAATLPPDIPRPSPQERFGTPTPPEAVPEQRGGTR